jgi:hypothetical protein
MGEIVGGWGECMILLFMYVDVNVVGCRNIQYGLGSQASCSLLDRDR